MHIIVWSLFTIFLLSGCANLPPPKYSNNLCKIFQARPSWYRSATKSAKHWHVPVNTMMAIMKQESHFKSHARPARHWFLFIPLPKKSTAYGYAQAQNTAWHDYKAETGHSWFTSRTNFKDSIDFIGWYIHKTHLVNHISVHRADLIYLNYHEGWHGYRNKKWKRHKWLLKIAHNVQKNAFIYGKQLKKCKL